MAANPSSTYTHNVAPNNILREDLEDYVYKISPLETPIMQSIGRKGKFLATFHEWPVVELVAPNATNAVIEGADAAVDVVDQGIRFGNYTQLSNKTAAVTTTAEAVRGAGGIQRMAKQVMYKTQEMKRDMEARIGALDTLFAVPGSASVARQTAPISAFIKTNIVVNTSVRGVMSAPPGGYPSTAATTFANIAITEVKFKSAIQKAWTEGGNPKYAFCGGSQKVAISAFTGNSTRFKKAEDRRLIAAIDVYESDFGQLQIVPDRFMDQSMILIIDPKYAEIGWLRGMTNIQLSITGNAERRLVSAEWGVIVGNQKAHAAYFELS